jgi:Mn2+/Fe2+ NRAMP family transporter
MNGRPWWRFSAPRSVPICFFWQASEEVEEEKAAGQNTLAERRGASITDIHVRKMDVGVGTFFSNMVMFFIVLATAITLNRHGITHIETSRQAAEALRPLAGKFATTLFTVGIVGVGFLAIPTLAGSAAYAFAETLRMAPRPGQEIEAGSRVLRSDSALNGGGRRTELRRH